MVVNNNLIFLNKQNEQSEQSHYTFKILNSCFVIHIH